MSKCKILKSLKFSFETKLSSVFIINSFNLNFKKFLDQGKQGEINFNFYEKNNHIGNERYAKANFTSYVTDNTSLKIPFPLLSTLLDYKTALQTHFYYYGK